MRISDWSSDVCSSDLLSNSAIAANFLSHYGRVAILDIDYHHGNGQQDIFYERDDVLTVSIHGAPAFAYPYFTGFRTESGRGKGAGYNVNIPMPERITPEQYRDALSMALPRIHRHDPPHLIVPYSPLPPPAHSPRTMPQQGGPPHPN